ncbi:glutathione S-transferase family protein [Bradyrhizobium ontarionense]|uniref:Glutathione S-transferase family protein n=1 Tax=Bradyrhizobium ontarionense TaxID=2898149 RepID=A0ABY3RI10_9BRAD|nr:glutathione S-transferase family protein [Bradyrhizobium sp. A19]UFZ06284.1 glutathione S-transferase family protein [Bradyrhizobium sp. A19]
MTLKLVIGNKNYSSWSMRPWLALRGCDIAFEEIVVPLYTDDPADKARIVSHSPAGKVPILVDGVITAWDSLAIIEYLAERFPQAGLWPSEPGARAHARSISAEMHSGFPALRNECPMNLHRPVRPVELSADAKANIARIEEIWRDCRVRYGGPFLFGRFGAADAMFAPVVTRLHTFAVPVAAETRAYMDTMMALPAFAAWVKDGLAEDWIIDRVEKV